LLFGVHPSGRRIHDLEITKPVLISLRDRCRRWRVGTSGRARDEGARQILEVMNLPRKVQDILDHADELSSRFEDYSPRKQDRRDPEAFNALRDAVISRSNAERSIKTAVDNARAHGYSWALIGSLLGTSGEAARQRYATKQRA
jgi:hypothetical protein